MEVYATTRLEDPRGRTTSRHLEGIGYGGAFILECCRGPLPILRPFGRAKPRRRGAPLPSRID